MKKAGLPLVFILIFMFVLAPVQALAQKGDNGYEGGISAGVYKDRTPLEYQEVCFITGEPLILKGELTIKKSRKQDVINATYTYNLRNSDAGAILTRKVVYNIQLSDGEKDQKIEKITLEKNPSEVLRINNVNYILRDYEFDFSSLTDLQPAINYYASSILTKKVYQIGNVNDGRTVTQEVTGKIHGYDQYWGNVETASLDYVLNWEAPGAQWGGSAHVDYSNSVTNELVYVNNIPEEMSFEGRYIQRKNYSSILQYNCSIPELDAEGEPTYTIVETHGSLKLDAPSEQISLAVPELSHLRGHRML
jgi:N-acetylmuramoyl-L-alanine amidase